MIFSLEWAWIVSSNIEMVEEVFEKSFELILHIFLHITKLTHIWDIYENMLIF